MPPQNPPKLPLGTVFQGESKFYAIIAKALEGEATVERLEDRALLALQGPEAAAVLAAHVPQVATMVFMDTAALTAFGVDAIISRSGYTGEDGYEISVPATAAERIWNTLLDDATLRSLAQVDVSNDTAFQDAFRLAPPPRPQSRP